MVLFLCREMSFPKMTRLLSLRSLTSVHQQLLLPSIPTRLVPSRTLTQNEYRRPGKPRENLPPWLKIKFDLSKGLEGIKKHFALLKKELTDPWVGPEGRPLIEHMLEQNRVVWEFRGPESLEQWTLSSDREIGGQSEIHLKLGRNNNTCFLYGTLCSAPPKDGETRYSGYCTVRSKQPLVGAASVLTDVPLCGLSASFLSSTSRLRSIGKSTTTGPVSTACTCGSAGTAVRG